MHSFHFCLVATGHSYSYLQSLRDLHVRGDRVELKVASQEKATGHNGREQGEDCVWYLSPALHGL